MGIGITIDNIAGTEEFCENMDTKRSTGIDFSNAPPDLPATFVEFVGKKGTQLKDTASGFEMKVGAGASSLLATAASVAASTIPEPTTAGFWGRNRTAPGVLSWQKAIPSPVVGTPTGTYGLDVDGTGFTGSFNEVMPTHTAGTVGDVCTLNASKNAEGSGLQLNRVARRPVSAVTGNLAEFDASDDPIDSLITKASVSNALVGTLPIDATEKTDDFAVTIGGCVYRAALAATKVCTLPAISSVPTGKFYNVLVSATGPGISLTVTPDGADTINGGPTATVTPLGTAIFNCLIVSNGTQWICTTT